MGNNSQILKRLKRKIKLYVKNALIDKTCAGNDVVIGRSTPMPDESLPLINIYSGPESSEIFDRSQKRYRRRLTILIECVASAQNSDDLDDKLEEMGELVEAYLDLDETFGGLVNKIEFNGSDYKYDGDGPEPQGSLILSYQVEFFTYAVPAELLDLYNFNLNQTGWKVGHNNESPDNVIDAEDATIIPQ